MPRMAANWLRIQVSHVERFVRKSLFNGDGPESELPAIVSAGAAAH